MSKYAVCWVNDYDGLELSVSTHDTLESAQEVMRRYWNELLQWWELPEGTTEFDLVSETAYGTGPHGSIGSDWLSYRNADGYGDEILIREV